MEVRRSCDAAVARVKAALEQEQRRADRATALAVSARSAKAALETSIVSLNGQLRLAAEQVEAGKEQLKQMVQLRGSSTR